MIESGVMVKWTSDVPGYGLQEITGIVSNVSDTEVFVNCCVSTGSHRKVPPTRLKLSQVELYESN